jgi:KaiC/GvpD/RAD55 family RecA-like ATPase
MNVGSQKAPQPRQYESLIPTGVTALDEGIGGGFPQGSLILLGGRAGTGKTSLASRILYEGAAKYGETGIYISLLENKADFLEFMKRFGYDFAKLEGEGKFRFIGFPTIREESVSTILAQAIEEIQKTRAKRLVIDSFTAIATALHEAAESSMALHEIFSKITRTMGCTTILITEGPEARGSIGFGLSEFLADGILILKRAEVDGRLLRLLNILKTKGHRIVTPRMLFTLENGFEVHPPLREPKAAPGGSEWKTIPDSDGKYSTGNRDLDNILDGGYDRGSYVLLDMGENVPDPLRHLLTNRLMLNFISQSRGVTVVPRPDSNARKIKDALAKYISEDKIQKFLRVFEKSPYTTEETIAIPYEGVNAEVDYEYYVDAWKQLKEQTEGRPILRIVAEETDEYTYGAKGILALIPQSIRRTAIHGDLSIAIVAPHLECTGHLANLANTHLKIREYHGYTLLYGVKPRTEIHIAEIDLSDGIPELRLHPVR